MSIFRVPEAAAILAMLGGAVLAAGVPHQAAAADSGLEEVGYFSGGDCGCTTACEDPGACEPAACQPADCGGCDDCADCGGCGTCQSCCSSCCGNPGGLIGELMYGKCCQPCEEEEEEEECDCCECRWCSCGEIKGDPWELPETCCMQCRGIEWGGWLSAGIYGNAHGADSNGPLGFNDVGDGFTFNQAWFYVEKAAESECGELDLGFRMDYVFGVDGPDTQAFGGHPDSWDNTWDTARDYGSAMPQLYVEAALGDLKVKVGHFYTIIGYEVVPAPDNFFYTHAYTMYYAEPFTHTGVLAEYPWGENITLYGGWTQGWDTGFDNTPGADTFLGGLSVNLTDKMTFTYAVSAGDFGSNWNQGDIYMNSLVLTWEMTDKLTYVFQHDLGLNSVNGPGDSQWYGINQYFLYQLNDCWSAGARIEWFRDDDGARVPSNAKTGRPGNYWELTCGLNWKPHANLVVRPELRYDWFDGQALIGDEPFNDGFDSTQLSGGFDFIFTY